MQGWAPSWEFEFGTRVWYSSGKFRGHIGSGPPIFGNSEAVSRLTYNGLNAFAGEYFQPMDSPYNIFLKGNISLWEHVPRPPE